MLIKDSGIATQVVDQMLEASLQKIGVVVYRSDANDCKIVDIGVIQISATRIKKGGQSAPILYPTSLDLALEMGAAASGHYGNRSFAEKGSIVGTIDVSSFGTLDLNDENLTVSVTGIPALHGVKIFAIEGDQFSKSSIEYTPNVVLADTPKKFVVAECHRLCLPVTGMQKLILDFADGRTATYQADELAMICKDVNDIVSVEYLTADAGKPIVYFGYRSLYIVDISEVVTATIHYTAQTKFFTIKNV